MSGRRHGPWRARFEDLKEAYVLHALSEDERQEFEGYLSEHPEAQAEVDALGAIAGLLALAPQEYEPSPELRRNLLSRIEGSDPTKAAEAPPRRAGSRGRSGLFGLGGLAAAAVAAAAVLAVVRLFPWNNSLRDENEDLLAEDEDLAGELETRQTYALPGSGTAKSVRGEVIEVREDRAVLMAETPPAPEGQVYEAWLLRGGVPEPAGLFQPRDEGETAAPIKGSLDGAEVVAVTVEPSGGSPMPTSDILLSAEL